MNREYNSRVSSKNSERLLKNLENTTGDYFFAAPCRLTSPLLGNNVNFCSENWRTEDAFFNPHIVLYFRTVWSCPSEMSSNDYWWTIESSVSSHSSVHSSAYWCCWHFPGLLGSKIRNIWDLSAKSIWKPSIFMSVVYELTMTKDF